MKVRWDEDVELIKDGLMEEDKELFCTLGSIMGKEVMGDFKFMPKYPPIMRMPDEMMDMIFSKLIPEDRLSCRLVTRRWATLLPIRKFIKCTDLSISPESPNPISADFANVNIPNHPEMGCQFDLYKSYMKDLQPLIDASLLQDVPSVSVTLCINTESRMEHLQTAISQHCRKLTYFNFEDDAEETESAESNWIWAKEIIAGNKQQLKTLSVSTSWRELDLSSDCLGECTTLQHLYLRLASEPHSVLNSLESVTTSLTKLHIRGIAILTKSQLLWVTSKFPHLENAEFRVHHNHSETNTNNEDLDEVDGDTILQVLNGLRSIHLLTLELGHSMQIQGARGICSKASHLRDQILPSFAKTYLYTTTGYNHAEGDFEELVIVGRRS